MIEVTERRISLSAAARLPILERDGRQPRPSTLFRWIKDGLKVHGVRIHLEHEWRGRRRERDE